MRASIVKTAIEVTFFLFLTFQMFGQADSMLIGQTQDQKFKAYLICDERPCKYVLKYLKGKQWDTLTFSLSEISDITVRRNNAGMGAEILDSCILTTIQIDRKGLPEIIVSRWIGRYDAYQRNDQSEVSYTINEIWNLDTRQKLFSARSEYLYSAHSENWKEQDSSYIVTSIDDTECSYNYKFLVDNNTGDITISDLHKSQQGQCADNIYQENYMPDHVEGIYIYRNGSFILSSKKNGK
jgi:hypothetical protein